MRSLSAAVVLGLALALVLWARGGLAQGDDEARRLFAAARIAMEQGDWAAAEAELAASYERLPGKGVAFNLAVCREHLGRLTSALALYRRVVDLERASGDEARAKIAEEHAATLVPRIARLRVTVAPSLRAEVRVDAAVVDDAAEHELDPGAHRIEVAAQGYVTWHESISLEEGQHREIVVPMLEAALPVAPLIVVKGPRDALTLVPPRTHTQSVRTLAFLTGGLGALSLAAGAAFALASVAVYGSASTYCDATSNVCTTQRGVDLRNESLALGDASTGTVIAGISLVVMGGALWLINSTSRR